MAKIYYQSARVRRFVPDVVMPKGFQKEFEELCALENAIYTGNRIIRNNIQNEYIKRVIRPAYLKGAYLRGKLKPMRLSDCYWELMEEEIDAEFDCSGYWDYLTRDGGLRY